MMSTEKFHGSADELVNRVLERVDDIDAIWVILDTHVAIDRQEVLAGIGGAVAYCNGDYSLVHKDAVEKLINDPAVRGCRIPFRILDRGEALPCSWGNL